MRNWIENWYLLPGIWWWCQKRVMISTRKEFSRLLNIFPKKENFHFTDVKCLNIWDFTLKRRKQNFPVIFASIIRSRGKVLASLYPHQNQLEYSKEYLLASFVLIGREFSFDIIAFKVTPIFLIFIIPLGYFHWPSPEKEYSTF